MDTVSSHAVEHWWRHLGAYDRSVVSGIPRNGEDDALSTSDDWWDSLTDKDKRNAYEKFFEEF